MAFGMGKNWWKRASGISNVQRKASRALGIPLSKGGRQRKAGAAATGGGCCIMFIALLGGGSTLVWLLS